LLHFDSMSILFLLFSFFLLLFSFFVVVVVVVVENSVEFVVPPPPPVNLLADDGVIKFVFGVGGVLFFIYSFFFSVCDVDSDFFPDGVNVALFFMVLAYNFVGVVLAPLLLGLYFFDTDCVVSFAGDVCMVKFAPPVILYFFGVVVVVVVVVVVILFNVVIFPFPFVPDDDNLVILCSLYAVCFVGVPNVFL